MYHKTTLPNGLKVMVVNMPYMESVALGIWIGAGGRYENKNNAGISHFLEHMVFKGTHTRSTRKIKESIEGVGGTLNGFTDEEMTCYFVKLPKKFIELGLEILSDMVTNPKLTKSDMDKERGVIFEEIKMYKDQPDHYAQQLLCELLWPNHPLGVPLIGTAETVGKIDRPDMTAFMEKFYSPENIVICACGQVDEEEFLKSAKKHFSRKEKRPVPHFKKFLSRQKKMRLNLCKRDTEQIHLNMGFHNVSRFHPDKYTSKLLYIIMGGNMSSRLFHEVREKRGLAYEISASIRHYTDTGTFEISAGTDTKKLGKAIEIIMKELKRIKKVRIQNDEFQRAKDFYKGQLFMGLEDTLSRMLWIGSKLTVKDISYNVDEIVDSIDLVTPDMIIELAGRIFKKNNMNVAVVGPLTKKDQRTLQGKFKL